MRLIDADVLYAILKQRDKQLTGLFGDLGGAASGAAKLVLVQPTVDAVKVVRCKDCKHRPTGSNRDDLEFPDDKCPCQCEDYWYSWKPADEWYCGNGERKDGDNEQDKKS